LENNSQIVSSEVLYEKYSKDILRYSYSILKSFEEAEDMVHEVFIRYMEKENSFKGDCSYKTWLLIITRNLCYNKLKSSGFTNERFDIENCNDVYETKYELNISIRDAMLKIPPEYSELLYLKEAEGYTYVEIAGLTSLTVENVAVKLYRAKQMMRKILKDRD
jgi:RNA polymerase sigma-70 factor (ECF subfamily)